MTAEPQNSSTPRSAPTGTPIAPGGAVKRVLFVDDESKVLDGLQRMLYAMRGEWRMEFVSSGTEALRRLSESDFDVLVTDIRMPVMSGIELLTKVVELHPQVVRLVLSGTVSMDLTLRSAALAHQYLVKPCDAATLRSKVEHALNLRTMMADPALKKLIARLPSLPSVPSIYTRLLQALRSAEVSTKDIGLIIEQDMAMTAKILQLANSAFLGLARRVATPGEAVTYLGVDAVRSLVLSASVFSQFRPKNLPEFSVEALQEHSLKVAALAGEITHALEWSQSAMNDTFVGGLLHDAGKLVLAQHCPDAYRSALLRAHGGGISVREAEQEIFGTTHADVGGYLLWLWGIPDEITEVAALHHRRPMDPDRPASPADAVHVADALINQRVDQDLDRARVETLGWAKLLPEWQERSAALTA